MTFKTRKYFIQALRSEPAGLSNLHV